jgi:glutaredoxin 3
MIVLNATDPVYGILSCNSKSKSLGDKTMVDYILDSLKLESTNRRPIKEYMDSKKQLLLYEAKKGLPIPSEWRMIDGDLYERVIYNEIESNILRLYAETYPDIYDSFLKLNVAEVKLIQEKLMNHYLSQDLQDLEIGDVIQDFTMNGIMRKDGQTIGSYYEFSMNKVKVELTQKIISKMTEAIQRRLLEPKFVEALGSVDTDMSNELPFTTPESDDVDVLEQLNIFLLSNFRLILRSRDVYRILNGSIQETNKIILGVMRLIAGTRNYIRDDKIKITNKFATDVLKLAFPNCEDLIVLESKIPPFVIEKVSTTPGFENVDPGIIWYYTQRYVIATGLSTINIVRDIAIVFDKVTEIGEKLALDNKTISKSDILRMRMQKKFNSSSMAFSPELTDKITIYEMEGCPWCIRAKELLDKKNLKYKVISYTTVPREDLMKIVNSKDGSMSFPIIVFGDEYIGGFTELEKLSK